MRKICRSHSSLSTRKSKFFWEELKKKKWSQNDPSKSTLRGNWKVCGHGRVDLAFLNTSHVYHFAYMFWSIVILEVYIVENAPMTDVSISRNQWTSVLPEVANSGMIVWKQRAVYTFGQKRVNNWRALLRYPVFLEISKITLMPFLNERWNQIKPWFLMGMHLNTFSLTGTLL